MSGSVSLTAILASLAVVISMATYIANKRRSNETQTSTHTALRGDRTSLAVSGSSVSPSTVVHRSSYYAVRAERHVSRHNAGTVEWRDDVLGVRMVFSPILFAVEREERQAPLVLVALRYLRQPEHSVAITIEACTHAENAADYRESSLERVRDCAKIIAMGTTRIGSVQCPLAEYCYVDNADRLRYVLSVFLTHDCLAVTAQYIADTRVKGVLPTAFNELVRSIEFSQAHETPSYLLCAEPRLGIGLRLPLDFLMEDPLRDSVLAPFGDGDDAAPHGPSAEAAAAAAAVGNSNSAVGNSAGNYNAGNYSASNYSAGGYGHSGGHHSRGAAGGGGSETWADVPFAVVVGRGARRMALIASYDSPMHSWPAQVERQLRVALARVGAVSARQEEEEGKRQNPVIRPYQRTVPASGDAAADESDAAHAMNVDGVFCVRSVRIAPTSLWAAFANSDNDQSRDSRHMGGAVVCEEESVLDPLAVPPNAMSMKDSAGTFEGREGDASVKVRPLSHPSTIAHALHDPRRGLSFRPSTDVPAHLCLFCLRVGDDDYVSFVFLASAIHHTLEEFITFCHRTLDSLSVGNHFGQNASLTYCNVRHEVLPFQIFLGPSCTVKETAIGDPVAIFGVGGVTVVLRIFPCSGGVKLERAVQHYLMLLPEHVRVQTWDTAAVVGARPALAVEYTCVHEASVTDSFVDDDMGVLDEEVGSINPFALCDTQTREETVDTMRSPSVDSREVAEDAELRVALVVCGDGCAFLFLAALGAATIWETRGAVRSLATGLTTARS